MAAARVHPTAVIAPEVELADNVEIGAHVVIEGKVRIGPECVIRPQAILCGPLTMGRGNTVYSGAVLGERPQHLKYHNEPTSVEIGDGNIIREFVTIHRGTTDRMKTVIGNNNFLMVNSHIGHDCIIGNNIIICNGAQIAGHCVIEDNAYLSGNCCVHQFVRIGRLSLLSGCAITTKDMPPFIMQQGIDNVVGMNIVGMRRAGLNSEQMNSVRRAFRILFREGNPLNVALGRITAELGHVDSVQELLTFLGQPGRGINAMRNRHHHEEAA